MHEKKFTRFCQVLKKIHTKENVFLFLRLMVYMCTAECVACSALHIFICDLFAHVMKKCHVHTHQKWLQVSAQFISIVSHSSPPVQCPLVEFVETFRPNACFTCLFETDAGLRRRRARVQIAVTTLSGNSLRQTVNTHCTSVHWAAKW